MANNSKIFFSKSGAEKFMAQLQKLGIEDVRIWAGKDGFNQTIYSVRWN